MSELFYLWILTLSLSVQVLVFAFIFFLLVFLSFVGMYSFYYIMSTSSKVNRVKVLSVSCWERWSYLSNLLMQYAFLKERISSLSVKMGFKNWPLIIKMWYHVGIRPFDILVGFFRIVNGSHVDLEKIKWDNTKSISSVYY